MIYAIASGKGGTGKTTLTASLASRWDQPVTAVDLDVEEPNLHLFLKPDHIQSVTATIEVPKADEELCTHCGQCAELCQFKAISVMGDMLLTFPEMCHGCGGCLAICPEKCLRPDQRELGEIIQGTSETARFLMGLLRIGEAMSPPLMRQVMHSLHAKQDETDVLIDAPPGVSCPAVCAVTYADCIVLVTEPTPFGFHDFKLAFEAFSPLGKPMGAVINRAGIGDDTVHAFCREKNIPIWGEIPYDRAVAEAYSRAETPGSLPHLHDTFDDLQHHMRRAATEASPCMK